MTSIIKLKVNYQLSSRKLLYYFTMTYIHSMTNRSSFLSKKYDKYKFLIKSINHIPLLIKLNMAFNCRKFLVF